MRLNFKFLSVGVFLLFIFILFSFLVDINLFKQFDFDATVRLQDNIGRRFDDIFSMFSVIGMFEITTIVLVALLIFKRSIIKGLMAFFLFGTFHIIEIFGKTVVDNIPPPEFLLRTKRLIEFPQFHVRSEYSYPSGHSGRTIFLSVLILHFVFQNKSIPRSIKIVVFGGVIVFDFLMLITRVYLGEHWVTDVIGGTILGASLALLAGSLYTNKTKLTPIVKTISKKTT